MKNWRPAGWKNPHGTYNEEFQDEVMESIKFDSYEAGADTMLEALKAKALFRNYIGQRVASEPSVISIDIPHDKGYVIFIPDKEAK